jgi:hypothetical protein
VLSNARGDSLASAVDILDLCLINLVPPTHLPCAANQSPSSPDVAFISTHLVPSITWTVHMTLNSDHLPITLSVSTGDCPPRSQRTYTNFFKADWVGFVREIESLFAQKPPPTSCRYDGVFFGELKRGEARRGKAS